MIGINPDAIDRAEDHERFQQAVNRLSLKQPENATVISIEQAVGKARGIGYPLVVHPSYVLDGRAMEIVYDVVDLRCYSSRTRVSVPNDAASAAWTVSMPLKWTWTLSVTENAC
ncbi:MAG: hypothetical protein ACR5LD_01205 [Symbiopectobacterium sp.]